MKHHGSANPRNLFYSTFTAHCSVNPNLKQIQIKGLLLSKVREHSIKIFLSINLLLLVSSKTTIKKVVSNNIFY